jgi:hypothetical protein
VEVELLLEQLRAHRPRQLRLPVRQLSRPPRAPCGQPAAAGARVHTALVLGLGN